MAAVVQWAGAMAGAVAAVVGMVVGMVAYTAALPFRRLGLFVEQPRVFRSGDGVATPGIEAAYRRFEARVAEMPFAPPVFLANTHLQTVAFAVAGRIAKSRHATALRREKLVLADGGTVCFDWLDQAQEEPAPWTDETPILLVLPTLTGGSTEMVPLLQGAAARGMRPVAFLKRGHGELELTTPRLQGFGDIDDLDHAVGLLRERYPRAGLAAVGLSAGSALLASYVGVKGDASELDAAIVAAPGYDCKKMFLRDGVNPLYYNVLLGALQDLVWKHRSVLEGVIDVAGACSARTFNQFDSKVYSPLNGFGENLEAYWDKNCPMRAWENVATPTLILNALDDPVCPGENIPYDLIESKPSAMLVTTRRGGHCGWYHYDDAGVFSSWAHDVTIEFALEVLAARPC